LTTLAQVAIERMDHVGIVVDDLAGATDFFVELGLEPVGDGAVGDPTVDSIVGLEDVRAEFAMLQTPDGHSRLELVKFESPPHQGDGNHLPANTRGLRHLAFAVDDVDAVLARLRSRGAELVGGLESYGGYRLCYVRGPEGIIVELAERVRA
jgi:catechol 2,3-dioxygenase-like lactoylglutathione lyase family enzyme